MSTRDLLIEVGTEELPPKALTTLANALADGMVRRLHEAGLAPSGHTVYAAPRRLAVLVQGVAERQPDREVERRGPAVNAAFDGEGRPSKALEGFARSCGVTVNDLQELATDKGAWMVYRAMQPGQPAQALIPDMLGEALDELPIPKRMRWGAGSAAFVRPVHWIVLLFGFSCGAVARRERFPPVWRPSSARNCAAASIWCWRHCTFRSGWRMLTW